MLLTMLSHHCLDALDVQHLVLFALVFYLASTVCASLLTQSSISGKEPRKQLAPPAQ
jgi:hypothetical protein